MTLLRAVLDGDRIVLSDGRVRHTHGEAVPLARLLDVMHDWGVAQCWLLPSFTLQQSLPTVIQPTQGEMHVAHPWVDAIGEDWDVKPRGLAPWLRCFRRGVGGEAIGWDRHPVDLVMPQYDRRTPYLGRLSGAELVAALGLVETLLGIDYRHSPEATASALLTRLHRTSRGKPLCEVEMPPPALDPNTERDMAWLRDRDGEEVGRRVVAYDVNGMYLAACSSLRSGVGDARHLVMAEGSWLPLRPSAPGYYFGEVHYTPPDGLPSPFAPCRSPAWMTHPTLDLAVELGAQCDIREAYVWGETSRPLEPWYKALRTARSALMAMQPTAEVGAALKTIKLGYGPLLGGRVASTRWDRSGDPLYRPDWRHYVIAAARANLYRALLRLPADQRPFAVLTDCAYFARLHDLDAPPEGLRVDETLGHFKRAGAWSTDEVDEAIASGRGSAHALAGLPR